MMDRRLIRLASEPVRRRVLTFLDLRPAGVGEVAAELGIDVSAAARHLEAMREEGLVEVVGEALNRGAVEPRYRGLVRAFWDDEHWAELSTEEQRRLTLWIVSMIEADIQAAVEQGMVTAREDSHITRTVSLVDEQGWRELTRIKQEALEAIFAVQTASAERLAEAGEEGAPVMSAMLCVELPPDAPKG
ncbi:MAG TPA: ArsR family transcriptional regulator [Solirubrobacterales bacterium]|nr:ArsR family transcriptional regulator [Solirubrobacterales bacterium]